MKIQHQLQRFLNLRAIKSILILVLLLISRIDSRSQQWAPLGKGFSNAVNSLFADSLNGKVFASGSFYYTDTVRVNGVAVWDGLIWDSLGSGASWVNNGFVITKYQNQIYTDAGFTSHTMPINCGGKFNGQIWDTLGYGVSGDIRDFYELNGELYVTGGFLKVDNSPCYVLAKWNGSNWQNLSCPYRNIGEAIQFYNGLLYIGGNILDSLGNNIDLIAWDGSTYSIIGGGISGSISTVDALTVFNGELYVGGYFTTSTGNAGNHIMKWNGTNWSAVGGGTDHEVRCMKVYNNELYVGGYFTHVGGIPVNYLAKWNGSIWSPVSIANINGGVQTIAFLNNEIYIGGLFSHIDTIQCNYVAKLNLMNSIEPNNSESHLAFEIRFSVNTSDVIVDFIGNLNSNSIFIISDITGREISRISIPRNAKDLHLNPSDFSKGIYLFSLLNDEITLTKKIGLFGDY